jgi:hypothetical protein
MDGCIDMVESMTERAIEKESKKIINSRYSTQVAAIVRYVPGVQ